MLYSSLSNSCSTNLNVLSDHHLLDLRKTIPTLTADLRNILDKIISFSTVAVHDTPEGKRMMDELIIIRSNSAAEITRFSNELGQLIHTRDVSEEKLKSALTLDIDLPKFNGYDSKIDVYQFRSEFEKLIEPSLQKQYWADYLKKKCLAGGALVLVDQIKDIDDIWKKLISSYGNARILLQNKIGSLEKHTGFSKIQGEEKIFLALSSVVNLMSELTAMAKRFKLEEELYYGGCLEKILTLLGNQREKKFVSKCEKSDATKPEEWLRLSDFLQKELIMRERLVLFEKSKKCLGIELKGASGSGLKNNASKSSHAGVGKGGAKCHICDGSDHRVVTLPSGRDDVPYFTCRKFIEMDENARRKKLFAKKLCAQCLDPGTRFHTDHEGSKEYACPNESHSKYKRVLHVLVCSIHKNEQKNQELLTKFKRSLQNIPNLEPFSRELSVNFSVTAHLEVTVQVAGDVVDSAIFMLQTIEIGGKRINLFLTMGVGIW